MVRLIEWIRTGLKKRKVKVFLIFLLCASLAWLINKLSQTYTSNTTFNVTYINIPSEFLLANTPKNELQVRLKAVGFQFLGYHLKPKEIQLDVSKVMHKDDSYYLTSDQIRIQLEAQLNNYSMLTDFDSDIIYFDFTSLETKKVPVKAMLELTYAANHILEGKIVVQPDSIQISGPKSQIDTISVIETELLKIDDLDNSFSKDVALKLPKQLNGTTYSNDFVRITGNVVKFSELVIQVPVTVINLPPDVKVRTFPEIVEVRCQGTLEHLKELEVIDFEVVADYTNVSSETGNRLSVRLIKYPKTLNNAMIDTNEIEFILRRE
ncbi:YbbR-like protein [Maribacter orientalis]|uniref:YbbR-like protein n=1 Tax=Maribacter orientalis TaxID=228957 RepID=A0A1H7HCI6_9FLAO|nr:YbbR-like domain-containing protein [Maribacter orientalis]SEK47974.1 YbbR-like protein [Maribacter orientalis]|tara:strand:+ start:1084 stop:2049 length:966 start_codon:yes stop_codon:yes gene_type:complete